MPKAKLAKPDYQSLKTELDTILHDLQSNELDVDTALKQYQRGLELITQLEAYLQGSENQVRELRAKFDSQQS